MLAMIGAAVNVILRKPPRRATPGVRIGRDTPFRPPSEAPKVESDAALPPAHAEETEK